MARRSEILVVEDNPGDAMLLREAFAESGTGACLSFARDGLEALDLLHEGGPSGTSRPDLVVLDLKMPRMDGLTFLRELRDDPSLRGIAAVILTSSDVPDDRETARSLGAAFYFIKPDRLDDWRALSKRLAELTLLN